MITQIEEVISRDNLLTHMQYMQDSKVRPSVFEKMKNVEPKILYEDGTFFEPSANSFSNRYIELMMSKRRNMI